MNHRNRNRVIAGLALGLTVGVGSYLGAGPGSAPAPDTTTPNTDIRALSTDADRFPTTGSGIQVDLPVEAAQSKLDAGLQALIHSSPATLGNASHGSRFFADLVTTADGKEIMVELLGFDANRARKAVAVLADHGLRDVVSDGRIAAGWLPVEAIPALAANADVQMARALSKVTANLGSVENQGHVPMLTDRVRELYGVDGTGIKIGIISTSFNLRTTETMQEGIAAGDLPGPGNPNGYTRPVNIVVEGVPGLFPETNLDEGRAMAEIVHDIAPGAEILFAGLQGTSTVHMANAMEALAQAGADIIVDDLSFGAFSVPFFQDDTAARKVNELAGRGIHYFPAAGNTLGAQFVEAPWSARGFINSSTHDTFDFNPDPAVFQPFLEITAAPGFDKFSSLLSVQWDEPWALFSAPGVGARNQLRLVLFNESNTYLGAASSTIGGNPTFVSSLTDVSAMNTQVPARPRVIKYALIKPKDGLPFPSQIKVHVRLGRSAVIAPSVTPRPNNTVYGHNNARDATVVGASSWFNTPLGAPIWNRDFAMLPQTIPGGALVGTTPSRLSPILSYLGGPSVLLYAVNGESLITGSVVGPQPILFDDLGNRLTQPEIRQNPSIIAPDAVQTSFFGTTPSNLTSVRPFFFGTSAAAPNAAAVGALMLQASRKTLSPAQLEALLTSTALDMDDPYADGVQEDPADPLFSRGYDVASGYGMVQALPALEQIIANVGIAKLNVNAQCRTETGNRWRIDNPNGFGVRVNLSGTGGIRLPSETGFGASLRENLLVPPGGLNFETQSLLYSTSVSLSWRNTSGTPFFLNKSKVGSWTACQ